MKTFGSKLICYLLLSCYLVSATSGSRFFAPSSEDQRQPCNKCARVSDLALGTCTAVGSFGSSTVCHLWFVINPTWCAISSTALIGLSGFCSNHLGIHNCPACNPAPLVDVAKSQELIKFEALRLQAKVQNLSCRIQKQNCEWKRLVHEGVRSVNRLSSQTSQDQVMLRIDYLTNLFDRLLPRLDGGTSPQLEAFMDISLDFDSVAGDVISLIQLFHERLDGQGAATTIDLAAPKAIFESDPRLCEPSNLDLMDGIILTLIEIMDFTLRNSQLFDENDVSEMHEWVKELRAKQLEYLKKMCRTSPAAKASYGPRAKSSCGCKRGRKL